MLPLMGLLIAAQEAEPASVRHELRVYLFEEVDEENDHELYEQASPLDLPFMTRGAAGSVEQRLSIHSACRWKTRSPAPATPFFPRAPERTPQQDGAPWESTPPVPRFPPPDPASRSARTTVPFELTLRVHTYTTRLKTGGGSSFNLDPLTNGGTPISPPTGGAPIVPGPPGAPPPPPPITKSVFSDGLGGNDDASASPYLAGPELCVPLMADASEWDALGWLPAGASLALYGHVLFGEMAAPDRPLEVTLYGAGPRLGLPLLEGALSADLRLSAGPAFLSSDLGETAGVDLAAGAGARFRLVGAVSLVASAEYRGFFAPDARAYGPSFNVGVDWSW